MSLIRRLFPNRIQRHGWIAIAALLIMNIIVFYGSRLLTIHSFHYDLTLSIDQMIPFVPCAIVIYAFAFVQWTYSYILSACEDKKTVLFIFGAEIIAKVPALVIFILLPTTMTRPEITGTDFFSLIMKGLYFIDAPVTLFPSFHCLESYLLLRTSHLVKGAPKWYRAVTMVLSPMIIFSILLVKQHVIVDILGGMAVVEFGILVMKLYFRLKERKSAYKKCHAPES